MYFLIFSLSLFLTKMTHLFSWYPTLSSFLSSLLSRPYSSVFLFEIYPDVCHTDKLENRPKRLTHMFRTVRSCLIDIRESEPRDLTIDMCIDSVASDPRGKLWESTVLESHVIEALTNWKKSIWDSLVPSKWSYGAVFLCAWLVEIH